MIRALWCRLFHSGTYSEIEIDQRTLGLRIERVLLRECHECGRVLYRAPAPSLVDLNDPNGISPWVK